MLRPGDDQGIMRDPASRISQKENKMQVPTTRQCGTTDKDYRNDLFRYKGGTTKGGGDVDTASLCLRQCLLLGVSK